MNLLPEHERLLQQAYEVRERRSSRYSGLVEGGDINAAALTGILRAHYGHDLPPLPTRVQMAWQCAHKLMRLSGKNPHPDDFRDALNYLFGSYEAYLLETQNQTPLRGLADPTASSDEINLWTTPPGTTAAERNVYRFLLGVTKTGDSWTGPTGPQQALAARDRFRKDTGRHHQLRFDDIPGKPGHLKITVVGVAHDVSDGEVEAALNDKRQEDQPAIPFLSKLGDAYRDIQDLKPGIWTDTDFDLIEFGEFLARIRTAQGKDFVCSFNPVGAGNNPKHNRVRVITVRPWPNAEDK